MFGQSRKKPTFLGTAEKSAVFLQAEVDFNQTCAGQKLHNHSTSDDWTDSEFHKSTTVGGKYDTHPVQRVSRVGGHDSIERDLGADQENKERDRGP